MDRRNLLKYAGLGAAGLVGAAHAPEAEAAPAYQGNRLHAVWVHGTALEVESPEALAGIKRVGWGTVLRGKPGGSLTWVHIPFSTPVIVGDSRASLEKVFVLYQTKFCSIRSVHVFDGPNRIKAVDALQLEGDRSKGILPTNTWAFNPRHPVAFAIGITLLVVFHSPANSEFLVTTAGADFRI